MCNQETSGFRKQTKLVHFFNGGIIQIINTNPSLHSFYNITPYVCKGKNKKEA